MLRLLLRCDLFRVVQDKDKHLTPPSRYGATMTIVMSIILSILLLGELSDYFRGHRQCSLAPSSKLANLTEAETAHLYQLSAVATFPYIPCDRLNAEILGDDWRVPPNVEGNVRIVRYATPSGSFRRPSENALPYAEGQIDAKEMGCTIDMKAPLPPIPVQLNLIVAGYDASRPLQFRGDHRIHEFRLGGEDVSGLVPQVTKDTTEPISHTQREAPTQDSFPYIFLFYVQYVRTEVIRPRLPALSGFQHTAQESLIRYNGRGTAPGVYMRLLPSPYSIRCTIEYDSVSHFLINLCAVVGGVYTVFGFVELAIETILRRRRQHERAYQNALNTEKSEKQRLVDEYMRVQRGVAS